MQKTLRESALSAVRPWRSIDAEPEWAGFETIPQQKIDVCLMCSYCADACDVCDGDGNLKKVNRRGRPRKEIDAELLREMLKLRRCRKDMCRALGISDKTLQREMERFIKEEGT